MPYCFERALKAYSRSDRCFVRQMKVSLYIFWSHLVHDIILLVTARYAPIQGWCNWMAKWILYWWNAVFVNWYFHLENSSNGHVELSGGLCRNLNLIAFAGACSVPLLWPWGQRCSVPPLIIGGGAFLCLCMPPTSSIPCHVTPCHHKRQWLSVNFDATCDWPLMCAGHSAH